jgi:hypothetical protein
VRRYRSLREARGTSQVDTCVARGSGPPSCRLVLLHLLVPMLHLVVPLRNVLLLFLVPRCHLLVLLTQRIMHAREVVTIV